MEAVGLGPGSAEPVTGAFSSWVVSAAAGVVAGLSTRGPSQSLSQVISNQLPVTDKRILRNLPVVVMCYTADRGSRARTWIFRLGDNQESKVEDDSRQSE